ncbi:hypothetical protein ACFLZO_00640 [Patescibacteria group bacterium]
MRSHIAVFGTRHIFAEEPLFEGQEPKWEEWFRGKKYSWYSTGKLEEAVSAGCEIFVCSIRPVFGPHDNWWRELVQNDHIFNSERILSGLMSANYMEAVFAPWKALFEKLGLPWDQSFDDFDDPAIALSTRYGVRDGSMFMGHALLC